MTRYNEIAPRVDLPALEAQVLQFWNQQDIFARSMAQSAGKPRWVFYEGPPTANGMPGAHHVEARTFKDIFPRYRTMKGFHVERRAGWDCHGLPVEIEVEKELKFSGKKDIETYGIAAFNAKCRESVLRHVDAFTQMTERMGYWVDFDNAYWTMDANYIESVWWSLKQIHQRGLLVEDYRVSPYCPRCGTGLSDHELAQGYRDVVDESAYVRMPITRGPMLEKYENLTLIAWTTTPWTLVSNTACAVGNELNYSIAKVDGAHLVVATELVTSVLGEEVEIVATVLGSALVGHHYQRPFDWVDFSEYDSPHLHTVLHADFVTTADGTGIVHEAPAFGAEDLELCRPLGLPVVNPVNPDGKFAAAVPVVGGVFFKDADELVLAELAKAGLLWQQAAYPHSYPHCWRCSTRLIYYAQPSWYIRTTAIKADLLAQNEKTNWFPNNIKWGRYGDWLNNNIDWALSRNRYWGTPLPIWRCEQGHQTAIESRAELSALTDKDLTELDPHRPFIDEITFPCPQCHQVATRVPEVIDVWYDSGAMPFAQWGAPHRNHKEFQQNYPADYICEAIDQTRGWFYSQMAIGTLLFNQSSFKNVVCLGHIQDEAGRKMSKSLGNVLNPMDLMDQHGADALRWFMLATGSPWQARRLGHATLQEIVRKNLLTYWATASFQALYGRIANFNYQDVPEVATRPLIDRWLVSQTNKLALEVDEALDQFDTQRGGKLIADFIDDLSNWYVRRNRRRFWDGDVAALATLHESLRTLTLVIAPFTPFIADKIWQDLFVPTTDAQTPSVHLASWPTVEVKLIDPKLDQQMKVVRSVVELGRTARAESKTKTRQPLARALISTAAWQLLSDELRDQIAAELNVKQLDEISSEGELVNWSVKGNFKNLGIKHGAATQQVAAAIATADAGELVAELNRNGSVQLKVGDSQIEVSQTDVIITETPSSGWSVASADGISVALDLTLSSELIAEGIAREVIRLVQDSRKSAGFEVTDRIVVKYVATDEVAAAITANLGNITAEVLAIEFSPQLQPETTPIASDAELGLELWLERV
jgi:isoleucyl-tRNA synthetase